MRNINKKTIILISIALILRILLMFSTFNSDMLYRSYYSSFLSEGVFDIYSYSEENNLCFINTDSSNVCYVYPPLNYYILGVFQVLTSPFNTGFDIWADRFVEVSSDVETHSNWSYTPPDENYSLLYIQDIPYLHWNLFLAKIAYLFFDILTLLVLFLIFSKKGIFPAILFWAFNPIILYSSEIIGNYDIILVFLILLAFYFLKKARIEYALIAISLAATIKLFPLFFIPPMIIIYGRTLLDRIKQALICIITIFLVFLPFIGNPNALSSFLIVGWNRSYPEFITNIILSVTNINISNFIAPYIIFIGLFYILLLYKPPHKSVVNYAYCTLIICLFFFSFAQFNLNYLMWAIPGFFIVLRENRKFIWTYIILALIFTNVLSGQKELNIGLFVPIIPTLYAQSSTLIAYLPPALVKIILIMFRICITGLGIIYIYRWSIQLYRAAQKNTETTSRK